MSNSGNNHKDELLDALERRAVSTGAEISRSMGEEQIDVVRALTGEAEQVAPDATLGGYISVHNRPPAFEGTDGQPYSVEIEVDATGEPGKEFVAFFVFLRWAESGAGIMAHLDSGDVAYGSSEDSARAAALELSLFEVKAELDAALERHRSDLED